MKILRFCSWVFYFKNYITISQRSIIVKKKWLFYLNIDSLNWRRGGSCIDTQITLETDKGCKFYLIKTQQRTKWRYHHIKKVNKIETKDLLIAICFEYNHWEIALLTLFEKRSSHTSKIKIGLNWLILHFISTSTLKISEKKVDGDVFFLNFSNTTGLLMNVNSEYCRTVPSLFKIQVLLWP